ncbi:MAG: transposase [Verrucomicrobiae bacterium]|nr:transposase [Verrucomicrobiae bacterium]
MAVARAIRVQFAGVVYHVMARGNERRKIFRDDRDRQRFVETLAEAVERFGLRLQAWCLMPNHYHLVVGAPRGNLSRGIGWLQATYTARFNARLRGAGHLFQGRFKAQSVGADEYGRWLVEYVHLNPVRPRRKGENDLLPITLAASAVPADQTVTLSTLAPSWSGLGCGGIRIWKSPQRGPGGPVLDNAAWPAILSTNLPASALPMTLYLEGVSANSTNADVVLPLSTPTTCTDSARFHVHAGPLVPP